MPQHIAAIDQGTTSTRFIVFDPRAGSWPARRRNTSRSIRSRAGWSTTPNEIWRRTREVIAEALEQRGLEAERPGGHRDHQSARNHRGVGPHRPASRCTTRWSGRTRAWRTTWPELARNGGRDRFRAKTGLPLATYFSALKIRWILDNVSGARARAEAGDLLFGNIDTFCCGISPAACTSPIAPTPAAPS